MADGNHDLTGADRSAVQGERRQMDDTRKRYAARMAELQHVLSATPVDPTYEPAGVVSPGGDRAGPLRR